MLDTVIKTFVKNYGYGSFIGVLSRSSDENYKKASLHYYSVDAFGKLTIIDKCCKETQDLEKLARKFINSQSEFILWSY
jgi:hypothetical protein